MIITEEYIMSIPNLPELSLILFIVLLIFGAGKLPAVASSMGKSIKEFRRGIQIEEEVSTLETKKSEETESTE
jgi:sec-independent protein translocase protein TatA|tara:strand:+ start:13 stop:231 length:219 start_codon:yes stop_codon:yes gene_type:complete